ncbi:MAG: hypothetical protein AB7P04_00190 [Bacteriovoracia bacterium]
MARLNHSPRSSRPSRIACLVLRGQSASTTASSIDSVAQACGRFSPQVAVSPYGAIFLEISRCSTLYTEASLQARLLATARRFGYRGSVSFHSSVALAWLTARAKSTQLVRIPIDYLVEMTSPLELQLDQKKEARGIITKMKMLGIADLGGFLRLPERSLSSRFGELALRMRQLLSVAEGNPSAQPVDHPWIGYTPPPVFAEEMDLSDILEGNGVGGDAYSLEPMLFLLKTLTDRLGARLRTSALRMARVEVRLELAKWGRRASQKRQWDLPFSIPQGSAAGVIPILRDLLGADLQRNPLAAPVQKVGIWVTQTAPGMGAQRDFFNARERVAEDQAALLERLMHDIAREAVQDASPADARKASPVGATRAEPSPERVFIASTIESYRPEAAWRRLKPTADSEGGGGTGALANPPPPAPLRRRFGRPSRLLREPIPVKRIGNRIGDWEIQSIQGPERLNGEWWNPKHAFDRDYFQVLTTTGEKLWLYADRISKSAGSTGAAASVAAGVFAPLFLQGFFD